MATKQDGLYVDVEEVARDWGCSRTKAYNIIRDLNRQMKDEDPRYIVVAGKVNRKYYEECCYKKQS